MLRYVVPLICAVALSACNSVSPDDLKPKEYLFNASVGDTKAALLSAFAQTNYRPVTNDKLQLVMERPSTGPGGGDERVTMDFLGDNPTKVTFSGSAIDSSASAFGRETDTTDTEQFRQVVAVAAARAAGVEQNKEKLAEAGRTDPGASPSTIVAPGPGIGDVSSQPMAPGLQ